MSDFERYGDYNEVDEAPGKNPVGIFIKVVALTLCVCVIALIAFRMIIFNTYPNTMKQLTFDNNERLTAYYNENDGDIKVYTQSLRAGYDNPDEGNFFCDNLYVIPEISQLQVSLRYNVSLEETLREKYGAEVDLDDRSVFMYRLWTSGESENAEDHITGHLAVASYDEQYMYKYVKLVFDDVRLDWDSEDPTEWIRLEVFIEGVADGKPFMICIYENNQDYSHFTEYQLKKSEAPE